MPVLGCLPSWQLPVAVCHDSQAQQLRATVDGYYLTDSVVLGCGRGLHLGAGGAPRLPSRTCEAAVL